MSEISITNNLYLAQEKAADDVARGRYHFNQKVILGNVEDFDFENFPKEKRLRVFVDGGKVYYISHPNPPHETTSRKLEQSFMTAAGEQSLALWRDGSSTYGYANLLCCYVGKKEADASFSLKNATGRQLYPVIVVEVAYLHESVPMLLKEGAGWLNEMTDVQYCLLVKISEDGTKMEVILLERSVETVDDLTELNYDEELTKELVEARGLQCQHVTFKAKQAGLEDLLKVRILLRKTVTEDSLRETGIRFNLSLENLTRRTESVRDGVLSVDITDALLSSFERIRDYFNRRRARARQRAEGTTAASGSGSKSQSKKKKQ